MSKTAIITGANRGIGRAMVEKFAANGYEIWACARTETDEFVSEMEKLSITAGVKITPVYFNLSNEDDIKRGIKNILSEKKNIDVLINNAGVAHGAAFNMTSIKTMREVYEVNIFAQVEIMQLVTRKMMRQESGGCIINMCSVGGIKASPGYLAYGSSKAALIWITKMAAKELGQYKIRVNGIAPSLVDTSMGHYKSAEEMEKYFSTMSLKRFATPEEISDAALYIASADFMTGHILVLDGGRSA